MKRTVVGSLLPRSKGEGKRLLILESLQRYTAEYKTQPTVQELQSFSKFRSFDTFTRHLNQLQKEHRIEVVDGFVYHKTDTPTEQEA